MIFKVDTMISDDNVKVKEHCLNPIIVMFKSFKVDTRLSDDKA